jgi:hypothetical protein
MISAEDMYKHLRFAPHSLHNGGNDAVWELRAWIAGHVLTDSVTGKAYIPDDAPTLGKNGEVLSEAPTFVAPKPVMVDGDEWEL